MELAPTSNKIVRETVQDELKSIEGKGNFTGKIPIEKEVILRPDVCHPILSNAMKPVYEK